MQVSALPRYSKRLYQVKGNIMIFLFGGCGMALKDTLKYLRKKHGWTQADLADRLEIKQYNVSDYEIGRIEPNTIVLCKMADTFQVSVDYLLGRKKPETEKDIKRKKFSEDLMEDKYLISIHDDLKDLNEDQKKAVADLVHLSVGRLIKDNQENATD